MEKSVTVGLGSENERQIETKDHLTVEYIGNRIISARQLIDETYLISVNNPKDSGRNEECAMWLSEDSLIGLLGATILYLESKGIGLERIASRFSSDVQAYDISENLHDVIKMNENTK